jgi:major outer membrane protein
MERYLRLAAWLALCCLARPALSQEAKKFSYKESLSAYAVRYPAPPPVDPAQLGPTAMGTLAPVDPPPFEPSDDGRNGVCFGVSAYFLAPFYTNNTAFVATGGLVNGLPNVTQNTSNFTWDYTTSPAFWISYRFAGGFKVRARMFYFNQHANTQRLTLTSADATAETIAPSPDLPTAPNTLFGAPGILSQSGFGADMLTFTSNLKLWTYDLDACVYERSSRTSTLEVTAGGRYVDITQGYQAQLVNSFGNAAELNTLDFKRRFIGAGPTVAVTGTRRVGWAGFSFYGTARGSLLVGQSRRSFLTTENLDPGTVILVTPIAATFNSNSGGNATLPIMDLEGGIEYKQPYTYATGFIRFGVVDQTYFGIGNASSTNGNMSLFGGRFSLGVNY